MLSELEFHAQTQGCGYLRLLYRVTVMDVRAAVEGEVVGYGKLSLHSGVGVEIDLARAENLVEDVERYAYVVQVMEYASAFFLLDDSVIPDLGVFA